VGVGAGKSTNHPGGESDKKNNKTIETKQSGNEFTAMSINPKILLLLDSRKLKIPSRRPIIGKMSPTTSTGPPMTLIRYSPEI
jgi:hypothetical protein